MATISLCMIVRDEQATLARCLDSVRGVVWETVIVDTGSADGTRAIAAEYTDRVYDFEWVDDFAAARNYAFSLARGDYVMWLDADDVLADPDGLRTLARELDARRSDVVMMKYALAFDGSGACTFWNYRERLLRRECGFVWEGAVHEVITPAGVIEYSELTVEHRPLPRPASDRNLRIYERLLSRGHVFSARELYYYARELESHARYGEAAARLDEFLSRDDGWVEDRYAACLLLGDCLAAQGDPRGQLAAYYRALEVDGARAALCCALGRWYFDSGSYPAAEFWYRAALACPRPAHGFVNEAEHGFLPLIWLCVCRDRQGDVSGANRYNELARQLRPDDPAVLHNAGYFAHRLTPT